MKTVTPPGPRRRGYTLIGTLLALLLLTFTLSIANRLFMGCVKVRQEAETVTRDMTHRESLVRLIRSDVWSASGIRSDDPSRVTLDMPDGTQVRWHVQAEWHLDADTAQTRIYRTDVALGIDVTGDPLFAPPGLSFRVVDGGLLLVVDEQSVRLSSMYHLLERGGS